MPAVAGAGSWIHGKANIAQAAPLKKILDQHSSLEQTRVYNTQPVEIS